MTFKQLSVTCPSLYVYSEGAVEGFNLLLSTQGETSWLTAANSSHDWAGGCINRNSSSAICLQLWWQPRARKTEKNKHWKSDEQLSFSWVLEFPLLSGITARTYFDAICCPLWNCDTDNEKKKKGEVLCNGKHHSVWFPSPCLSESVMRRGASNVLGPGSHLLLLRNSFWISGESLCFFVFLQAVAFITLISIIVTVWERKYYWSDMQMTCLLTSSVALN